MVRVRREDTVAFGPGPVRIRVPVALGDGKPGGSYMAIVLANGTKLSGNGPGQSNYGEPAAGTPSSAGAPAKP